MINEEDYSSKQEWQEAKDKEEAKSGYDFAKEEADGTLSAIDELTISINEIYQSYKRAGFNVEQAFDLATIHLERALDRSEMGDWED